jgi:hypothetical protein
MTGVASSSENLGRAFAGIEILRQHLLHRRKAADRKHHRR